MSLFKRFGKKQPNARPAQPDTIPDFEKPKNSIDRRSGDRARDLRDWHEAAANYDRHLVNFPDDFAIWVQLGHARKQLADLVSAEAAYLRALEISPRNADLLVNLGHFYKMQDKLSDAAGYYLRSFSVDGNQAARAELSHPALALLSAEQFATMPEFERRSGHIVSPALRNSPAGNVDSITGWEISGWAVDRAHPNTPAMVGFFRDGKKVGETRASNFRGDVAMAALGSALSGFTEELDLAFGDDQEIEISIRLLSTGEELGGSPVKLQAPENLRKWVQRKQRLRGEELDLVRACAAEAADGKRLSIVMPVYDTKEEWLRQAIDSVLEQWSGNWELLCVDDASPDENVRTVLREYAARDPRIRPVFLDDNGGIAVATNAGIGAATGDYVGFLDHDDYLEPDAVHRMLAAGKESGAELIYSDEVITRDDINIFWRFLGRPAFSHDFYLSHPYFVHFICVRADVAREIGGWDETMSISADVDFVLRVIEKSLRVAHVPAVLYRWRTHETSTGHSKKGLVTSTMLDALTAHVKRFGYAGHAEQGPHYNTYKIDFDYNQGKTLIVIPTKNSHGILRKCLESIWETTTGQDVDILVIDHDSRNPDSRAYLDSIADRVQLFPFSGPFNYAKMNNAAVAAAGAAYDYILFMNNDIEVIEAGWFERLRSLCGRGDVGVAGATLLYDNRTIQHSGVVMGLGDLVDHAHKFQPFDGEGGQRNIGYLASLVTTRDYSAVTGACMMIPTPIFVGVGGFDESLEIGYNDTDLCMRIGTLGYKILNDGLVVLYHHESLTRAQTNNIDHPEDGIRLAARWSNMLIEGDPFYNPLLSHTLGSDHRIGSLNDWHAKIRVREVRPKFKNPAEATPEKIGRR